MNTEGSSFPDGLNQEAEEIRSLQTSIKLAEQRRTGKKISTYGIWKQLRDDLASAEATGIELGSLKEQAMDLIVQLPAIGINNCRKEAETAARAGNEADADYWRQEAAKQVTLWFKLLNANEKSAK